MSADDNAVSGRGVDLEELGRRLFQARGTRGWSQHEVVRRAGLSSRSRLSRIERGRKAPTLDELVALTKILELDVIEALFGTSRIGSLRETARIIEEIAPASEVELLERFLASLIGGYRRALADGMGA